MSIKDNFSIRIECETRDVCSFCEESWESAITEEGVPICCNKAEDEWLAQRVSDLDAWRLKRLPAVVS